MQSLRALFPLSLLAVACSQSAPHASAPASSLATATLDVGAPEVEASGNPEAATAFEALDEYLGGDRRRARLWSVRANLESAFDYICGDTFCEGDYSNLRPLALDCSVARDGEVLQSCLWVFAGSYAYVDGASGRFAQRSSRTFECEVPMNGLTVDGFLGALEGATSGMSALEQPLGLVGGRAGPTFYDALMGCL